MKIAAGLQKVGHQVVAFRNGLAERIGKLGNRKVTVNEGSDGVRSGLRHHHHHRGWGHHHHHHGPRPGAALAAGLMVGTAAGLAASSPAPAYSHHRYSRGAEVAATIATAIILVTIAAVCLAVLL